MIFYHLSGAGSATGSGMTSTGVTTSAGNELILISLALWDFQRNRQNL